MDREDGQDWLRNRDLNMDREDAGDGQDWFRNGDLNMDREDGEDWLGNGDLKMDVQEYVEEAGQLEYGDLSGKVIGAAFEVINELGAGFLETVYEKALWIALQQSGLKVERQCPIQVNFRGSVVGDFYADLLVEDRILVELKAVKALAPEHQAQVINYLKATGISVGLLINFGTPRLEYRRFTRRNS
jgi:GxxExxY protein